MFHTNNDHKMKMLYTENVQNQTLQVPFPLPVDIYALLNVYHAQCQKRATKQG